MWTQCTWNSDGPEELSNNKSYTIKQGGQGVWYDGGWGRMGDFTGGQKDQSGTNRCSSIVWEKTTGPLGQDDYLDVAACFGGALTSEDYALEED